MRRKVLAWCREQALFPDGGRVVCAVSGGADSTAMLHCLLSLRAELGIEVSAAHYNHHLRGAESDRDEAFVRTLCDTLGVPLTVSGGDVRARAEQTGESIEEAARKLRYAFLETLGGTVATAHSADDNLETVLLELVRGTALRGLCGIPPKRGAVVRPLLCVTRGEIEAYLLENGLSHVEDSTNAAPDARRNRIRQDVVPLLRRENPSLSATVLRASLLLRKDEAYLEQAAEAALADAERPGGWSCEALLKQPEVIRSRAVRSLLRRIRAPKLTSAHIEAVCALLASPDPSAECMLPGGWTARRRYALLTLCRGQTQTKWEPVRLNVPGVTELPVLGLRVVCHYEAARENTQSSKKHSTFACKCDRIELGQTLWARPRAAGDRMRLSGGHRSLKRILIDRKIPAEERDRLPVIADKAGVLAVWGVGVDLDRAAEPGADALVITIEQTM